LAIGRIIFPEDYKRRRHYDMTIDLMREGVLAAPEPLIAPTEKK